MPEPITVEQARAHLRVFDTSEDALIEGYISAARAWVENYTGHVLVRRTITEYRPAFTRFLELSHRPVVSVDEVSYTDTAGADQTYADPLVSVEPYPTRVFPAISGWWPSTLRDAPVKVTYTAGYEAGQEPEPLLQAVLILSGHYWSNRSSAGDPPGAVYALCDQYRSARV